MADVYYNFTGYWDVNVGNSPEAVGADNKWVPGSFTFNTYDVHLVGTSFKFPVDATNLFYGIQGLHGDFSLNDKIDTSECTSFKNLFRNARTYYMGLNFSNWDTSNVTDMSGMFAGNIDLIDVNLSNWDTSNVTTFEEAFYGIGSLETLDLTHWTASGITSATGFKNVFRNSSKLRYIYVDNDTDWKEQASNKDADDFGMFGSCSRLPNFTNSDVSKNRANSIKNYGYFTGVLVMKKHNIYEKIGNTWKGVQAYIKDTTWKEAEVYK